MLVRPIMIVAVAATALVLAGCSSDDSPEASTSNTSVASAPVATTPADDSDDPDEPVPEVTPDTTAYTAIGELTDAIAAIDDSCDDFTQDDAVTKAVASGTCGKKLILSLYETAAIRDEVLNEDQASDNPGTFLVGANWLVQAGPAGDYEDIVKLHDVLGGFIVPTGS
jgi:hypothetical protein